MHSRGSIRAMSLAQPLAPGTVVATDYRVEQEIARGGMGTLYRVTQLSTGADRVLKVMHARLLRDPRGRERFLQEARASARIESDHVVQVLAAGFDGEGVPWIVMELLRGEDLSQTLKRRGALPPGEVLEVFRQLGHALAAAHRAGLVHRDLKPDNVFLCVPRREGVPFTVKLLDFGIAKALDDSAEQGPAMRQTSAVGTPLWMAPEQAQRGEVTPTADVWSMGLLAFKLLVGRSYWRSGNTPDAPVERVLRELFAEPIDPASQRARELGAALPPGFDAWFARCVARDARQRFPTAAEAVAGLTPVLLGPQPTAAFVTTDDPRRSAVPPTVAMHYAPPTSVPPGPPTYHPMYSAQGTLHPLPTPPPPAGSSLLGAAAIGLLLGAAILGGAWLGLTRYRADRPADAGVDARAALRESFARAADGRAVLALVSGPSGIGKSALVQHHVDELARADGAFVLQGRCDERESVPYKALDGVIDALVRALRNVDEGRLVGRLFATAGALARVFPAFRALPAVANLADDRSPRPADPWELRRVAAAGLCAAVALVDRRRPLLIYIDDLQWADADSAELLKEFLRARAASPTQFVVSFRPEGRAERSCLRLLLDADLGLETREVVVGPLGPELAARLAGFGLDGTDDAATVERIARESGGNPFFVQELNRYVREAARGGGVSLDGDLSLDAVMLGRVARLPVDARCLAEVVALAGGSIPAALAFQAAGVGRSHKTLAQLRWGSLVRSVGVDGTLLTPYHDRVREAVASSLSADRTQRLHASLAAAWSSVPDAEPEVLLTHHRLAGALPEAVRYAGIAAARAAEALAFDHAARLYRLALSLTPAAPTEHRALQLGLARALAGAGRGAESAAAYLASAEGAAPAEQLDRRRLAAEQFLRAGYIDQGLAVATQVLEAVGVSLPATPGRGLLRLLMHRAQLWTRGLEFVERPAGRCDPAALARFDACWSIATGLAVVDTTRASALQSYSLLLALELGEPSRVARAFAMEAGFSSTDGLGAQERTAVLLVRSRGLARQVGDPVATASRTRSW